MLYEVLKFIDTIKHIMRILLATFLLVHRYTLELGDVIISPNSRVHLFIFTLGEI